MRVWIDIDNPLQVRYLLASPLRESGLRRTTHRARGPAGETLALLRSESASFEPNRQALDYRLVSRLLAHHAHEGSLCLAASRTLTRCRRVMNMILERVQIDGRK